MSYERQPTGSTSTERSAGTPLLQGLKILEFFAETHRATAAEVSEHFGMPLSTTYRYIRQLWEGGYLYRLDGIYSPGRKMLTGSAISERHLVHLARPMLTELCRRTGNPALLSVRVETVLLCLDVVTGSQPGRLTFRPGQIQSLHAGASAEVLLAFAPCDVVESVTDRPLRQYTAKTPQANGLRERLLWVREQGYAVSFGELTAGVVGIAAPVVHDGHCVCAVSVVLPEEQVNEERIAVTVRRVCDAATELTADLGAVGQSTWAGN